MLNLSIQLLIHASCFNFNGPMQWTDKQYTLFLRFSFPCMNLLLPEISLFRAFSTATWSPFYLSLDLTLNTALHYLFTYFRACAWALIWTLQIHQVLEIYECFRGCFTLLDDLSNSRFVQIRNLKLTLNLYSLNVALSR